MDRSLRRLPIDPAAMRLGENQLLLECDYDENHPGLEIVYLLGSFGTAVRQTDVAVSAAPKSLKIGDWVGQGLAFYSGSVGYVRTIRPRLARGQRLFVQVPDYRGSAVQVLVNEKSAGVIAWPPNEVDITDLLDGRSAGGEKVELCIKVIGHRRNSHGPLHLNDKQPRWIGPGQFITGGKDWTDGYHLVPCGLMKPPRLIIRR